MPVDYYIPLEDRSYPTQLVNDKKKLDSGFEELVGSLLR